MHGEKSRTCSAAFTDLLSDWSGPAVHALLPRLLLQSSEVQHDQKQDEPLQFYQTTKFLRLSFTRHLNALIKGKSTFKKRTVYINSAQNALSIYLTLHLIRLVRNENSEIES